jgi:hypothetical protein
MELFMSWYLFLLAEDFFPVIPEFFFISGSAFVAFACHSQTPHILNLIIIMVTETININFLRKK